jgi:hypothetical protein
MVCERELEVCEYFMLCVCFVCYVIMYDVYIYHGFFFVIYHGFFLLCNYVSCVYISWVCVCYMCVLCVHAHQTHHVSSLLPRDATLAPCPIKYYLHHCTRSLLTPY